MSWGGLQLPRATIGVTRWRRFRAAVDWPLILTVLVLCAIGLLNLYSATRSPRAAAKFDAQVQWMVVGAVAFIVATVIDYRTIVRGAPALFAFAIVGLIAARMFGSTNDEIHGSTARWLSVFGARFQPSEAAKIGMILMLAQFCSSGEPSTYTARYLGIGAFCFLLPVMLIAAQPDLGTAVLLVLIVLTVGYLAMPNVWPMVYATAAGLLAIPVLWEKLHEYQKNRILAFVDCSNVHDVGAPSKLCWHTQQSVYAVGSGKIWGKGFLSGTQSQGNFVPEHWTDFPYSVWGEEWGFVGSVFLLAVFGFLLLWTINVALSARDRVGATLCLGVAAMTFWHVVVNVAMVLGIAPVVGVTLPFISYGGSSLVTFFLSMGLVANVSLRKHGY